MLFSFHKCRGPLLVEYVDYLLKKKVFLKNTKSVVLVFTSVEVCY